MFCSIGNEIKLGKSHILWNLEPEFQSVSIVGLGEQNKQYNESEQINENKEAVRLAASGMIKIS